MRVGPVLCAGIVWIRLAFDEPPVVGDEAFRPPAVADRHVRGAVDGRFHPARAACLERLARVVQPDVAALHQKVRHVEVVIFHERDAPSEFRIERAAIDALEVVLAYVVRRMRLARKENLNGSAVCIEDGGQAIGIGENQFGALYPVNRRANPIVSAL